VDQTCSSSPSGKSSFLRQKGEFLNRIIHKEVVRRSGTTQHETEGDMAMFTFSPAVLEEFELTAAKVRAQVHQVPE